MLRPVTIWPHKGQHTQSSHNLSRSYTNPNHIYANSPIFTKILHRPTPPTCIVTNNKQLSVFTVFFNKRRRKKRVFSCQKNVLALKVRFMITLRWIRMESGSGAVAGPNPSAHYVVIHKNPDILCRDLVSPTFGWGAHGEYVKVMGIITDLIC